VGKPVDRSGDWLKQAERDLQVARHNAASGYHEWAAFAAQQSAEKALKALAQSLHGEPRGHSLTALLGRIPLADLPTGVSEAARELDQVYITSRYPNGFAAGSPGEYFSESTSERLLNHAEQILHFCRSQIPRS
jgi:HEPN domain-containing protein